MNARKPAMRGKLYTTTCVCEWIIYDDDSQDVIPPDGKEVGGILFGSLFSTEIYISSRMKNEQIP